MNRRMRAVLDIGVAVFFVVLFLTREGPDYTLHSVLGLIVLVPVALHVWPNRRWVTSAWSREGWGRKIKLSRLNAVLATFFAVCTISGIFSWVGVSEADVPHAFTGFVSIGAAIVHGFRNRDRFLGLARSRAAA